MNYIFTTSKIDSVENLIYMYASFGKLAEQGNYDSEF